MFPLTRVFLVLTWALMLSCAGSLQAAEEKPMSEWTDETAVRKALKLGEQETVLFVGDMHCVNCAKRISRKLYIVKGVLKVRTDLKLDVAIVTPQRGKKLDAKALWSAATASGILPIKLLGPSGVMEADTEAKEEALKPQDHAADKTAIR